MTILELVKKIQVDRSMTDSQMATLLGYKQRENWCRIKAGRAPATVVFEARAIKAFPELIYMPEEKSGVKALLDKIVLKVKKFI
jgi:hypothetical protein